MSGRWRRRSRRRSRASQAYVKYWNDRGGVNGHQLEL